MCRFNVSAVNEQLSQDPQNKHYRNIAISSCRMAVRLITLIKKKDRNLVWNL